MILLFIFIAGGFTNTSTTYSLKLDLNQEFVSSLSLAQNEIVSENDRKFGRGNNTTKLLMNFDVKDTLFEEEDVKIVEVEVKGRVINGRDSFPFNGADELYLVKLNKDREVFFGNIKININHKTGDDIGIISLRYEPQNEQADLSITSGPMSNTAMLPFGNFFITFEELNFIYHVIERIGE